MDQTAPQQTLSRKQQAKSLLDEANSLVVAKRFREAMLAYHELFSMPEAYSVRLPAGHLRRLVRAHKPAEKVLLKWRDQKEQIITRGDATRAIVEEWAELNGILRAEERILKVFESVRQSNNEEQINYLLWEVWKILVRQRRYEDLKPFLSTLGWLTFLNVADYDCECWFPGGGSARDVASTRRVVLEESPLHFEVAVGLKETMAADVIKEKILYVDSSDQTYARLITACIRAKDYTRAQQLLNEAKENLGPRRTRKSNAAAKKIPLRFQQQKTK